MVVIRSESAHDADAICRLHAASFPTPDEATLVGELRDAGDLVVSLLAEVDADVRGHVAFSVATLAPGVHCVGLAPVAVAADYRNRGIAAALVRAGIAACTNERYGFVVVLGDPRYYDRFGFVPAATRGLVDEYGGGDAFQVLELRPGAIPGDGGLVRYAPAFARLGGGS